MTAELGELDIVGIGNAIVDVLAHTDDDALLDNGLVKGSMTLIDADRADALHTHIGSAVTSSGGSSANTVAAAASFGADVGFVGKVCDDTLGEIFTHDIRSTGVHFDTTPLTVSPATARSLVMVSPDGQRTMSTYLGACVELGTQDVDTDHVGRARVVHLEGYLWDQPRAREAARAAMAAAHARGRRVALTLSDAACVERHRDRFLSLLESEVDILFTNDAELRALFRTDDLDDAVEQVRERCAVVAATRGARGSVVISGDSVHEISAEPVETVVDTTGAGDAYAAGFLHGFTRELDLAVCARLGAIAAAEIITHVGARPRASLAELALPVLDS